MSREAPPASRRTRLPTLAHDAPADGSSAFVADEDGARLDGAPLDAACWRDAFGSGRLGEVQGSFAVAMAEGGILRIARDAIGERTAFYTSSVARAAAGSSPAALMDAGAAERVLDHLGIVRYLCYAYLPGGNSLVAGVREVLPGEAVELGSGFVRPTTFAPLPGESPDVVDEAGAAMELRSTLEGAVSRRLPAGEPVGAFLSGGLDSSLVVALAARLHDAPVRTYSIAFGPDLPNELAWSSMVAAHCRTRHRVVDVTPVMVQQSFDATIAALPSPIGDPLTVPNFVLFGVAAGEVGVVLNGEGGDPCFGGPKNLPMVAAAIYGSGDEERDGLDRERSYLRSHQKCYDELGELLDDPLRGVLEGSPLERELVAWFQAPRYRRLVTKLMALNVAWKGGHHILPKVDALSARHGVIARSPLFDREVVRAAFAVPPALKLRGNVEKYILKRSVADLLPDPILARPKSGMLVPVEHWFAPRQGPLWRFARERLLDGLAPRRLVRRDYLEALVEGKLAGARPRRGVKVWLLLTLEAWLRLHL